MTKGDGTKGNPWKLKTPPGTSEYEMYRDVKDGKEVLVCTVGKTVLLYDAKAINDLHAMLKKLGDWMELGGADEQKPAREGTVESWARSAKNPVRGWYGLKKDLRGRQNNEFGHQCLLLHWPFDFRMTKIALAID